MCATLKCHVQDGLANFSFPQVNRKLSHQVDEIMRVIQDKCELEFTKVSMQWEKGQSTSKEIGLIIAGLFAKPKLTHIKFMINQNNKLNELFIKNLIGLITAQQGLLEQFEILIEKNCLLEDILNPVMNALAKCTCLKVVNLQIIDNNSCIDVPFNFSLANAVRLKDFKLHLNLQSIDNLDSFSRSLSACSESLKECETVSLCLTSKKLSTLAGNSNKMKLDFLKNCEQLSSLTLKSSLELMDLDSTQFSIFAAKLRSLTLKLKSVNFQSSTTSLLQLLRPLANLETLTLSFKDCLWDSSFAFPVGLARSIHENSPNLAQLKLHLQVDVITPQIYSQIVGVKVQKLEIDLFARNKSSHSDHFRNANSLLDLPVLASQLKFVVASDVLKLQCLYKSQSQESNSVALKVEATETMELTSPEPDSSFKQIGDINILFLKCQSRNISCELCIQPCLFSNYNKFKSELFLRLLQELEETTSSCVKVGSEFEYGARTLIISLDRQLHKHFSQFLELAKIKEVNRLVVYHSFIEASTVCRELVDLFVSKPFLKFQNNFMYSETRTQPYKNIIKPMSTLSERNQLILKKISHILKKAEGNLTSYQLHDLIEVTVANLL